MSSGGFLKEVGNFQVVEEELELTGQVNSCAVGHGVTYLPGPCLVLSSLPYLIQIKPR